MSEIDLTKIANLLETTMCGSGIFDDYDEVIGYMIEDDDVSDEETAEYHSSVIEAIKLINQVNPERELKVEYWQETYDDAIDLVSNE